MDSHLLVFPHFEDLEHLAGIENFLRIESVFNRLHGLNFGG